MDHNKRNEVVKNVLRFMPGLIFFLLIHGLMLFSAAYTGASGGFKPIRDDPISVVVAGGIMAGYFMALIVQGCMWLIKGAFGFGYRKASEKAALEEVVTA